MPALGMESQAIANSSITASSEYSDTHASWQARLKLHFSGREGGWSAKTNVAGQWIQIELGKIEVITRVATQGRADLDQWITAYYLKYRKRTDETAYVAYKNRKEFSGNTDSTSIITHDLSPPIIASSIQLVAVKWHKHISLRMEIYGCKQKQP